VRANSYRKFRQLRLEIHVAKENESANAQVRYFVVDWLGASLQEVHEENITVSVVFRTTAAIQSREAVEVGPRHPEAE
jgi:hypothetical protein